jgi:hypothetical protein
MNLPQLDPLTIATFSIAATTLILAFVTVFQDWLKSWVWHPKLKVSAKTAPPDCIALPMIRRTLQSPWPGSTVIQASGPISEEKANCIFFRIFIENTGHEPARNVEVYAKQLLRQQADKSWALAPSFPPMNLKWSWFDLMIHYPIINPRTGRHCDIGHIIEPSSRERFEGEENPDLHLTQDQVCLAFELVLKPNNRSYIVQPGNYRLIIDVGAQNSRPKEVTVQIYVQGRWYNEEPKMLSDGVVIQVL